MLTDTLSFKKLFSDTGEVIKKYYKYVLLFVIIIYLPLTCIRAFVVDKNFDYASTQTELQEILDKYEQNPDDIDNGKVNSIVSKLSMYFIIQLVFSALTLLCDIAAILSVKYFYENKDTNINEMLEAVPKLFPKLLLTRIIAGFFCSLGFLCCFLPGIIMLFVFYFVNQSVVIDGIWGKKGLLVSSIYQRTNKVSCAMIIVLSLIYTIGVTFLFTLILGLFRSGTSAYIAADIVTAVLSEIFSLFAVIAVSVFYVNIKPDFDFSKLGAKPGAVQ